MNIDWQRRIDRVAGRWICRVLSLWPAPAAPPGRGGAPRRILVILLSEMGSLVLAWPMFRRLRQRYPEAELHALVFEKNREVLDLLGVVPPAQVWTLRDDGFGHLAWDALRVLRGLRRLGMDVVIDCELFARVSAILARLTGAKVRVGFHPHTQEGLYRGDFINRPVLYNPYHHIARQFLTLAEAVESNTRPPAKRPMDEPLPAPPPVPFDEAEIAALRARLHAEFAQIHGRRLVLLYPGGGALPIRAWPEAHYVALARALLARGYAVGIIGLPTDREQAARVVAACGDPACVSLAGWTRSVRELLQLFHVAELLVTNDGGPGHFAVLTPIRGLVLFGPETPRLYGPLSDRVEALHLDYSCSPCLTAYNHRNSPCDGDNRCVAQIPVDRVLERALHMLEAGPP